MTRDTFDLFQEPERGRFGDNERQIRPGKGPKVTGTSDLIDLTLSLREQRPKAIAVVDPGKPASKWIWLPRSQIEIEVKAGAVVVVTLPEWLAKDKGLI